jgi:hypothetical protein
MKQHIEASEQDGVDREEVTSDQARRLSVEEVRPSGTGPSRSGIDAVTFEDRPDARRGELAMDPPIAPGRVLTS